MFYTSFGNTLLFIALTVPTGMAAALLLAALTHNKLKGMKIFRFIFSLPMAVSVGTGSMIWMILYHPTLGILNYFLSLLGTAHPMADRSEMGHDLRRAYDGLDESWIQLYPDAERHAGRVRRYLRQHQD